MRFDGIEMNGPLLGKTGANIASASTVDLSTATGNAVTITGTTTITSFGTVQSGAVYALTFSGVLTLTHNGTSLILPTGGNITTQAGDVMIVQSLGSGNWKCIGYTRADGTPLVGVEGVTGLTVDNTDTRNPVVKPVYSFFNGVPGATENVAAGYIVGQSRVVDYNTQIEYLYVSGTTTAVWQAISDVSSSVLTSSGSFPLYSNTRIIIFDSGSGFVDDITWPDTVDVWDGVIFTLAFAQTYPGTISFVQGIGSTFTIKMPVSFTFNEGDSYSWVYNAANNTMYLI